MTGIKLESLAKITQTKSNSGETVEQYVVNKVLQHFPDALKVGTDMPSIEAAKAVLFPRLVADLRKLEDGISMMKTLIEFDTPTGKMAEKTEKSGEEKSTESSSASKTSTTAMAPNMRNRMVNCRMSEKRFMIRSSSMECLGQARVCAN